MTSLAQQLQSLALKGVTFDVELRKRPSFLFDSQEAAGIDTDEAYAIGVNGFEGLCSIDKVFEESSSLFDELSKSIQRSTLTKKENADLDKEIAKFVRRAAPYFLLRSTHKCIEWLVYRFRVQHFNAELLLFAFLPYHTSKVYTRLLQLFDKSFLEKKWPILNSEVTPSKSVVLEQCLRDRSFFANICENLSKSLKECDQSMPNAQGLLRPAVNLFTIYSMEMIEHLKKNQNEFLATLMSYLVIGVKSKIPDFKSASYMIITLLSSRMTFTKEVATALGKLIADDYKKSSVSKECLLALINLCQAQENLVSLSNRDVTNLIGSGNFTDQLLSLERYDIGCFIAMLLLKMVEMDTADGGIDSELLVKIVQRFQLAGTDQKSVVSSVLESLSNRESNQTLLKALLALHKKYPEAVQNLVGDTGAYKKSGKIKKLVDALMIAAQQQEFSDCSFLSFSVNFDSTDEAVRYSGAMTLMQMLSTHSQLASSDFVRQSLKSRLEHETSPAITALLLEIVENHPAAFFADLESAGDALMRLTLKKRGRIEFAEVSDKALEILMGCQFAACSDELREAVSFLLRDMIFYQACVQEKDIIKSLNKDLSFVKKNNWILSDNWKSDVTSIIDQVAQTLTNDPELFFKFKKSSARVSKLLGSCPGEDTLPFDGLVNFAVLKSAFPNKTVNPRLYVAALSVVREINVKLQSLFLRMLDDEISFKRVQDNSNGDFAAYLLTISSAFHDGHTTVSSKVAVTFKILAETYGLMAASDGGTSNLSHHALRKDICSAIDNFKSETNLDQAALYSIMKQEFCDFFVHTLPFINQRAGREIQTMFQNSMKGYLKSFFKDGADVSQFLTQYWSCNFSKSGAEKIAVSALSITKAIVAGSKSVQKNTLLSSKSIFVPSLLLALHQGNDVVRSLALECLSAVVSETSTCLFKEFAKFLTANKGEILHDASMIELISKRFFRIKGKLGKEKIAMKNTMKALLENNLEDEHVSIAIKAGLLVVFKKTVSTEMTIAIMPELSRLVDKCIGNVNLCEDEITFVKEGLFRVNAGDLSNCKVRAVFWKAIACNQGMLSENGAAVSAQTLCLGLIDKEFYGDLLDDLKQKIVSKLVDIAALSKGCVDVVGKVFKSISLDAGHVKSELAKLMTLRVDEPVSKKARITDDARTDNWNKGVLLLEFLQEKKKITDVHVLFPTLFQILESCLDESKPCYVSENAEYVKQLVLTLVRHLFKRLQSQQDSSGTDLRKIISDACKIQLVVHCVRSAGATQTQHHALLLLTEMANYFPEKVLHNIMAIFTFMGSHLMRQDDSYSLQVVSKTMRVVIPALTKATKSAGNKNDSVLRIIHAFVDSLPHIPEHRKIIVLRELLDTIGGPKYMWIVMLLLGDLYVKKPAVNVMEMDMEITGERVSAMSFEAVTKICCAVCESESPRVQIDSIVKSMDYILTLPFQVGGRAPRGKPGVSVLELKSFDTAKLRKFYMASLTLLTQVIEHSHDSILTVLKDSQTSSDGDTTLIGKLQTLYERVLQLISNTTAHVDSEHEFLKFRKALITKCYAVMRSVNRVLPFEISVAILDVLLNKEDVFIKCKAMELLAELISSDRDTVSDREVALIGGVCNEISGIILKSECINAEEHNLLCYTALATIKTTVRKFGKVKPEAFHQSIENLCLAVENVDDLDDVRTCAALFLSLAEMCHCLKAYCIPYLNKFVPPLLKMICAKKALQDETLLFSCVTLMHRILENLLQFSSTYLGKIVEKITALLLLEKYSSYEDMEDDSLSCRIATRLKVIVNVIGTKVPSRILVDVFSKCLETDSKRRVSRIKPLCLLVLKHVESLKKEDAIQFLPSLTPMLYKLLEFRSNASDLDSTAIAEFSTNIAVTTMLKLPENLFRTLFFGLSDWAENEDGRLSVYYRLMCKLSSKMKALFSLFCGIVIENAVNVVKGKDISQDPNLLGLICVTLKSVFFHDNANILTKERFELLAPPLVELLEAVSKMEDASGLIETVRDHLIPLLGEMVSSVGDDTCQKSLNYQVLLKSRHSDSEVRRLSLKGVEEIGNRMGAEYSMLLPESIPFLSELMEDDDECIESECHAVIRSLEKALGEPLQKYFNE